MYEFEIIQTFPALNHQAYFLNGDGRETFTQPVVCFAYIKEQYQGVFTTRVAAMIVPRDLAQGNTSLVPADSCERFVCVPPPGLGAHQVPDAVAHARAKLDAKRR